MPQPRIGSSITRDFRASGRFSKRPTRRVGNGSRLTWNWTSKESYEVIDGELEVQVDGEWSTVKADEKVVIPPDTEHSFKNTGPAEVINIHEPAMQFEEFFRRFHRLKTERGVPMPPDGLKSSILLAMLVVEHEDEQRVVSPPHWVFKVLSRIGHLLGYRLPD